MGDSQREQSALRSQLSAVAGRSVPPTFVFNKERWEEQGTYLSCYQVLYGEELPCYLLRCLGTDVNDHAVARLAGDILTRQLDQNRSVALSGIDRYFYESEHFRNIPKGRATIAERKAWIRHTMAGMTGIHALLLCVLLYRLEETIGLQWLKAIAQTYDIPSGQTYVKSFAPLDAANLEKLISLAEIWFGEEEMNEFGLTSVVIETGSQLFALCLPNALKYGVR